MINKLPDGEPVVSGVPMLIMWALAMAVVGHIVLTKRASATGSSPPAATLMRREMSACRSGVIKICPVHGDGLPRDGVRRVQVLEFDSAASTAKS